jgi:ferredoxin
MTRADKAEADPYTTADHDESRRRFTLAAGMVALGFFVHDEFNGLAQVDPNKLHFSKDHLWITIENGVWTLGVTNHVVDALGTIKCVYLVPCCHRDCSPKVLRCGSTLSAKEKFGTITSTDIFDLLMPVSGKILSINDRVMGNPHWVNSDPYGKAWMMKIRPAVQERINGLMAVSSYTQFIKRQPQIKTHRDIPSDSERYGYVVTELCVNCKYTDCAAACPVCAFHELPDRLYINPATCISCDACVPECPVEAIFDVHNLPEEYEKWVALNRAAVNYPAIGEKKVALHKTGCVGPPEERSKGEL